MLIYNALRPVTVSEYFNFSIIHALAPASGGSWGFQLQLWSARPLLSHPAKRDILARIVQRNVQVIIILWLTNVYHSSEKGKKCAKQGQITELNKGR